MNQREKKQYETDKEIERLRWKCLVRNKKFQEWWSWAKEKTKNPSTPVPPTETFKKRVDKHGNKSAPRMLCILLDYKRTIYEDNLTDDLFDIHWDYIQECQASEEYKSKPHSFPKPVENYRDTISGDIDFIVRYFTKKENREPTITELKDLLINWLMTDRLYLQITQRRYTYQETEAITKQIFNLLKKHIPKRHFSKAESERYLRVYDLRNNGLKWKDVCAEIYPNKVFDEVTRHSLLSDKKKAEKMIANAEKRLFFGKLFR